MTNGKTETNKKENAAVSTELVFVVDRSGSMQGLESDTVGGFNGMLADQKKTDAPCFVSTVLFDHETEVLHDRAPLKDVAPITEKEYYVRGCTALLDALGGAIRHVEKVHRYIRPEDVPERTLFVVITDGMENASKKYSAAEVKKMIGEKKELGWEFIFLGANIDAVDAAAHIGISADRAVNYHADAAGTGVAYQAMNNAVSAMRCDAPMSNAWREEADADFAKREKKNRPRGLFGKKG